MRDLFFSKAKNFRCERKFYIDSLSPQSVEQVLRSHPAIFREIYHERTINNIYFDTPGLQFFSDNLNGTDRRLKVRIRWYGEMTGPVAVPVLELKLRQNIRVSKLQFSLREFTVDNDLSIDTVRNVFAQSKLGELPDEYLSGLEFSLLNRYSRKYFLSSNGKYRATIDAGMQAFELFPYGNNYLNKSIDRPHTVLELKYDERDDTSVDLMTNHFPFRMTRSSKYAAGISEVVNR